MATVQISAWGRLKVCKLFCVLLNFLEFCEISQNTKFKFGRNFRNPAKYKIKIWTLVWPILLQMADFKNRFLANSKQLFIYLFILGQIVHQIRMDFF